MKRNDNILLNKQEIQDYLGGASDYTFRKYVKCGLPARIDGRDWIAHKANVDSWFRWYTNVPALKQHTENVSSGDGFDDLK